MSFWESKKIRHARKEHICEMCSAKIHIGDSCSNEVGVYDGDFNNYYLCTRCRMLLDLDKSSWLGDDNELYQIEDTLFGNNYLICPNCNTEDMSDWYYTDDRHLEMFCKCSCGFEYKVDLSAENLINIGKRG